MIVTLKNSAGMVKQAKIGFSWTNFFFGIFVPLFRGDWKWCIIQFIVAFVTFGLSWLVFPFIYNKIYLNDLLEKGYRPADEASKSILVSKGFITDETLPD